MLVLASVLDSDAAVRRPHLKLTGTGAGTSDGTLPRTYFYRLLITTRQEIGLGNIQAHQCVGNYTQIMCITIIYTRLTYIDKNNVFVAQFFQKKITKITKNTAT